MTLFRRTIIAVMLTLAAGMTSAQTTTTTGTASTAPTTTTATPATALSDIPTSQETRTKLSQLLDKYPPEVGKVLKLDPSLWRNPSYLASYPQLAAFAAAHPEVANNPRYYLADVWIPSDPTPETQSIRLWRELGEGMMILFVFLAVTSTLVWLIKTLVSHRRWSRVARVQYEMQNKLLDRMTSNEELTQYLQSPGLQRILNAVGGPVEPEPRPVSAAIGRVLWSVQAGIVLLMAGIGFRFISGGAIHKDVAEPVFAISILAMAIGVGFILSAIVSYVLSRRLGLWEPMPELAARTPGTTGE